MASLREKEGRARGANILPAKDRRGATYANGSIPSPHHRIRSTREERSTRFPCLTSLISAKAPAPVLHSFTRRILARASHAICDILAQNVGIVRKACRWGADVSTSVMGSATRVRLTYRGPEADPQDGSLQEADQAHPTRADLNPT